LHRVIEKIKDSPSRSQRRTFEYLYRKLNESIRDSREDENSTAVQRNLISRVGGTPGKPEPKGNGKGKKGDTSNPKDGGKGGRSKSRGRGKRGDKTPKGDRTDPPQGEKCAGKGKGKKGEGKGADAKAKAKADPKGKSLPKRDASRPPLTDEQKANIVCRFWKQNNCSDAQCKFAHSEKVPGSMALVKVPGIPAKLKPQRYVVELMGDTGAGRHLGSVQAFINQGIPEKVVKSATRETQFPIQFETGGGEQGG
jgi:hypothetical protein